MAEQTPSRRRVKLAAPLARTKRRPSTDTRSREKPGKKRSSKGRRRYKKRRAADDFGMGLGLGGDYEDRLADEREERRVSRSGVDRL